MVERSDHVERSDRGVGFEAGHEGRIVVDVSDPVSGAAALAWAERAALVRGAEIVVVSVLRPSVMTLDPASVGWANGMEDEAVEWMRAWQRTFVFDTLGPGAAEFVAEWRVVVGDPVRELVSAARHARFLVVGRPPRAHRLRRTRAQRCSRSASCAVVEVPLLPGAGPVSISWPSSPDGGSPTRRKARVRRPGRR